MNKHTKDSIFYEITIKRKIPTPIFPFKVIKILNELRISANSTLIVGF